MRRREAFLFNPCVLILPLFYLQILGMDDLTTPKYIAERFGDLPKVVTGDEAVREDSVREPLCEILVAELGPSGLTCPYLIVCPFFPDG